MNCYSLVCTGASLTAAPINTGRRALLVQNQDRAATVWLAFGMLALMGGPTSLALAPQESVALTEDAAPTERIEVLGPVGARVGVWEQ